MPPIRTLVVDDEPLARTRITRLLDRYKDIQCIGEARNGKEALEKIRNYQPDLVFLDIQMPDFNGFEVLAKSSSEQLPFIIFVTAYDQYALKAFDVHAVDYLLKPYDDERFDQALQHALVQIRMQQKIHLHQKMLRLLNEYRQEEGSKLLQIEIKEKGVPYLIEVDDIQYVEAHGNYLKLHVEAGVHLLRQTMQAFEEAISRSYFLRIHRSLLINTHYLEQLSYQGNNQYRFSMRNGAKLLSSRGYREAIESYLSDQQLREK